MENKNGRHTFKFHRLADDAARDTADAYYFRVVGEATELQSGHNQKKNLFFLIEIFYDLNNRSSFPPPATASHPRLLMNSRRNPPPSCTEEESLASGEKKQKQGHAVYLNGEPGRRWFFTWMSTACSPTAVAVKETLTPAGALCTWTGMLRWLTPAQMTQKRRGNWSENC